MVPPAWPRDSWRFMDFSSRAWLGERVLISAYLSAFALDPLVLELFIAEVGLEPLPFLAPVVDFRRPG